MPPCRCRHVFGKCVLATALVLPVFNNTMKKQVTAVLVSCLCAATHGLAQGTVNFNNFVFGSVNAPITNEVGVLCSGTTYLAQLFAGPAGTPASALTPVGAIVTFRTGGFAGYVNVGASSGRTIPGVAPGAQATVQIRVWAVTFCFPGPDPCPSPTVYSRLSDGLWTGATGGVPDPVTGVPSLPANLVGLQGFQLVPEPATYVLFGIGAMAVFLHRRK